MRIRRLYSNTASEFIEDTRSARITTLLKEGYRREFNRRPPRGEISAWTNSLQIMANVMDRPELKRCFVGIEQSPPNTNARMDFVIYGRSVNSEDRIIVIELKQWTLVEPSEIEECVKTRFSGNLVDTSHPSVQARNYRQWILDFVADCAEEIEDCMVVRAAAYLHNMLDENAHVLRRPEFADVTNTHPMFFQGENEITKLVNWILSDSVDYRNGYSVFDRFERSEIKPSKKLIQHMREMVDEQKTFTLLDEQIVACNTITSMVEHAGITGKKSVIVVEGGPGTGKSAVALNVFAKLLELEKSPILISGAKAFKMTTERILGSRVAHLNQYTTFFYNKDPDSYDITICDEAHRLRAVSDAMYIKKENRSGVSQIAEIIRCNKVSVFFLDEKQIVTPNEVGTKHLAQLTAAELDADFFHCTLETQFRCAGSGHYLDWIDSVLNLDDGIEPFQLGINESMHFEIVNSPHRLREICVEQNEASPNSARIVAGYCWPWMKKTKSDGSLINEVVIDDFEMPWEAPPSGTLQKGIPRPEYWAYMEGGKDQIGCIYTCQGFEFDTICVIIGKDLIWKKTEMKFSGFPGRERGGRNAERYDNHDHQLRSLNEHEIIPYVKHIYRTLLTRGMRRCFVYFLDDDTENRFREHISNELIQSWN